MEPPSCRRSKEIAAMNEAVKLGFAGFSTPRDGVLGVF